MISLVTGTLNRKSLLEGLIRNTVDSNEKLELVLVDGGSTDGTVEFLEELQHPRIKLIKIGHRSTYPHFMNIGIKHASHDFVCQWNDDALLVNSWDDVIKELSRDSNQEIDVWIFSWQYLPVQEMQNYDLHSKMIWNICNEKGKKLTGDLCLNYGVYRKELFKKYGLFDDKFFFYYADSELCNRFYHRGARLQNCDHIRVASIEGVRKLCSPPSVEQIEYYEMCRENHAMSRFQSHLELLNDEET